MCIKSKLKLQTDTETVLCLKIFTVMVWVNFFDRNLISWLIHPENYVFSVVTVVNLLISKTKIAYSCSITKWEHVTIQFHNVKRIDNSLLLLKNQKLKRKTLLTVAKRLLIYVGALNI